MNKVKGIVDWRALALLNNWYVNFLSPRGGSKASITDVLELNIKTKLIANVFELTYKHWN